MGTTMIDTSVFGALNRATHASAVAKDLLQLAANGETLMVGASAYQEILKTPDLALRNAQLQQIKDFNMQVQQSTMAERIGGIGDDFAKATVDKTGMKIKPQGSPVQLKDLPIASDVKVEMARAPQQKVKLLTVERMAENKIALQKTYGIELSERSRVLSNLGERVPYEPQKLGVKPASAPVTELPPASAPEIATAKPGAAAKGGVKILEGVKQGLKQGLKDLLSPESLMGLGVSLAAMGLQSYADIVAAETAIKRIQIFFIKEGFAKGYAAGALSWTEAEVADNAMNHITMLRVKGMGDAGGKLNLPYILKLAETYENYAVAVGWNFAYKKPNDWKKGVVARGVKRLKSARYDKWGSNSDVLFTYEFLAKIAWALHTESDAIVGPAIRTGKK